MRPNEDLRALDSHTVFVFLALGGGAVKHFPPLVDDPSRRIPV